MKLFNWNSDKNTLLIQERGLCFEDVVFAVQQDKLLDDVVHPNKEQYPNQRIMVIELEGYVYLVPYIENEQEIFLKTIIPSRKARKKYLGEDK
ncbi:BrnT family toxin [Thiomicrospira sp. R3]|uniref:BrnT family toxin n=1 Tax=Thiomicrospira sp. R3 TaxID=3035472 RepID=UPI00259B768A|nr:BrnT family toxin [Thiomicrospira sp. R3]WFE68104.1 BrnT family toxin [Thiomicrospira sp. R3]